jgi:hypothetical protein
MTDKSVYEPKSTMYVKFIVTNTDDKPLYLLRQMNQCSSQMGSYQLVILDDRGKEVSTQQCSADLFMDKLDVVETLTNPNFGIALMRGQIYGSEGDFQLPAKPGKYRVEADVFPPGLLDKQRQALAEKNMRVLECTMAASPVTITVK